MKRSILIVAVLAAMMTSCTPEPTVATKEFYAYQQSVSASNITIAWHDEYSTGGEETYKIAIYSKSDTNRPYQSYSIEMKENTPRAFTFSLLQPNKGYLVSVTNQSNITTEKISVATTNTKIAAMSDIILQNFDNLCWGYDYMQNACGVKTSITTSYSPETLEDTIAKWEPATNFAYDIDLTKCSSKLLSLLGLSEWKFENVFIRPGYIRIGGSSSIGKLYTNTTRLLPEEGCTTVVSFKACQFNTSSSTTSKKIKVSHLNESGTVLNSAEIEIEHYGASPKWSDHSTTFTNVLNNHKFLFETDKGNALCLDEINIRYDSGIGDDEIFGYLLDNYKAPVVGAAVSDGFTVVRTDSSGLFHFKPSPDAYYIFYSVPSEYAIEADSKGRPAFFQRYKASQRQYDFTLKRLAGGREQEFVLFGLADPQTGSTNAVERFSKQVAPEIKSYSASLGKPCYGITLGDVISMGSKDISKDVLPAMCKAMHADNMGMPVFQVMGNHDNCFMSTKYPVGGKDLREINLNIQRMFEEAFGPINYSFNRGSAHIIGMRNVQWLSGSNCATANTRTRFTEDQYKWLLQDLACVDNQESKLVILCVHVPLYNDGKLNDGTYRQEILNLLDKFSEAHILSGHLHYQRNYDHKLSSSSTHKIYEHAQAAVNGASWTSNINGDGVPNGYGVYHIYNNTIKDWYYKGYAEGMNDRNYQMRLYRGNAITGAEIPKNDPNTNNTKGYYQFGYAEDDLLANVFNSDSRWRVEVYEDDQYSGTMTSLAAYHWNVTYDQLIGSYVYDDPKRPPVGAECGRDFWAVGVLCGHLGMNTGGLYYKHCYQMWKYKLKNKDAKIEVRATDRKGNLYTCSTITEGTDMTYALYNK